eukprot:4760121-Pyramimonas_sp.AAC.1
MFCYFMCTSRSKSSSAWISFSTHSRPSVSRAMYTACVAAAPLEPRPFGRSGRPCGGKRGAKVRGLGV